MFERFPNQWTPVLPLTELTDKPTAAELAVYCFENAGLGWALLIVTHGRHQEMFFPVPRRDRGPFALQQFFRINRVHVPRLAGDIDPESTSWLTRPAGVTGFRTRPLPPLKTGCVSTRLACPVSSTGRQCTPRPANFMAARLPTRSAALLRETRAPGIGN